MSMPGFTAETSLGESRKSYRTNGVISVSTGLVVAPQLRSFEEMFGETVSLPPKNLGPVYFQCGWNPKTLTSECTCRGDADCNRMFTSGFCGDNASCDTGAGTCRCDFKL
jgi:hypothetical protein